MAVNLAEPGELFAVPGVRLGSASASVKVSADPDQSNVAQAQRDDVAVVVFDAGYNPCRCVHTIRFCSPSSAALSLAIKHNRCNAGAHC